MRSKAIQNILPIFKAEKFSGTIYKNLQNFNVFLV